MTTTQYIGARYVPLFATPLDWDSTQAYDALTIVYYAGNSYTSRQAVPAGIQITNENYWALTGNYNAQIEQYRAEVKAYDERITTADTTANNALSLAQTNEKDIATLDSEMAGTVDSGLKNLITNNADSIAAETARAEAAELVNKNSINANKADADSKFSGESDSGLKTLIESNAANIATNTANIATNTANITANANAIETENTRAKEAEAAIAAKATSSLKTILLLGDSWTVKESNALQNALAAFNDVEAVYNFGVDGAQIFEIGSQAATAYSSTTFDNDKITDVVIVAGTNNVYHNNAYTYSDVLASFQTVTSKYPKAKTSYFPNNSRTFNGGRNSRYRDFIKAALAAGATPQPSIMMLTFANGFDDFYDTTAFGCQHLSATGYANFAGYIHGFLNGVDYSNYPVQFPIALSAASSSSITGTLTGRYIGTVSHGRMDMTCSGNVWVGSYSSSNPGTAVFKGDTGVSGANTNPICISGTELAYTDGYCGAISNPGETATTQSRQLTLACAVYSSEIANNHFGAGFNIPLAPYAPHDFNKFVATMPLSNPLGI